MPDNVNWDRVEASVRRYGRRMDFKLYGYPDVLNPFSSAYIPDREVLPKWKVPEAAIISAAVTGAFYTKRTNPNQPITTNEIASAALECLRAGATTVHIHVRDDNGNNVVDPRKFAEVVAPLREEFPGVPIDGCLVPLAEGDWEHIRDLVHDGIFQVSPINATAMYCGDSVFAKPPHVMIEKAKLIEESGAKAQLAVYTDADVDNARRYLIASGLLSAPPYWIVLPGLPGGSPMHNTRQMIDGLTRIVSAIYDIDDTSVIMVCAAGRASTHLTALALLMGLHVRVGMEDSIWLWPHRDELIPSNAHHVRMALGLAELLGRRAATTAEYLSLLGTRPSTDHSSRQLDSAAGFGT